MSSYSEKFFLLILLSLLPSFGWSKERITERGSSLFYRSWRYPVDDKQAIPDSVSTTPQADTLSTFQKDSLPAIAESREEQDTLPAPHINSAKMDEVVENTKKQDTLTSPQIDKKEEKGTLANINSCILYFKFDQDNFITDYSAEIDTLLQFIDFHKGEKFLIAGHTDERGTVAYNQILSEKRARKVYDVLIRRGISPTRLSTIGKSELSPLIPHAKNEKEHQKNRRVEL